MTARRPLIELLPVLYRLRDAEALGGDGLLEDLFGAIEEGIADVEQELADRYDDLFVETADPDELGHLQALVGLRELPGHRKPRALVANVIRFRRSKGTLATLEDLARAATGWPARAVEYFTLLATTQNLGHLRPDCLATTSVRDPFPLRWVGTPFDGTAHTADVRSIGSRRGLYNLPNVGIHLWRLLPVEESTRPAVALDSRRFRFHPLGLDTPLYSSGRPEGDVAHLADPPDVTMPIRRIEARAWLSAYYGAEASFAVADGAGPIAIGDVAVCDLGDDGSGGWAHLPTAVRLAVDPERGRLAFAAPPSPPVLVTFHRALPSPIGGGGYRVADVAGTPAAPTATPMVRVAADGSQAAASLEAALTALGGKGVVEVVDSARYAPSGPLAVATGHSVTIRAADHQWPVVEATEIVVTAGEGATVVLDGLLLTGGPLVVRGSPARVTIRHCTLVPGHRLGPDGVPDAPHGVSLVLDVDPSASVDVVLDHSVSGPILASRQLASVEVRDSILTAGGGGLGRARSVGACLGARLSPFPALPSGAHALRLSLGVTAAYDLTLAGTPTTIEEAADMLRDALALVTPDLDDVTVTAHDDRLIVYGPGLDQLRFADGGDPAAPDPTATRLGLVPSGPSPAATVWGLLGTTVADPPMFPSVPASASIVIAPPGPSSPTAATVTLAAPPLSRADAAVALETAIRAGVDAGAVVVVLDDRLLVVPSTTRHAVRLVDSPTSRALGLESDTPVLAGSGDGVLAGPDLTVDRSTLLGAVHADTVELSDTIVTGPVTARRRQAGCVRYSYIGAGSATPRLFRSRAADNGDDPPDFTTTRYGHPAFCQLTPTCPSSIGAGASDGAEMGAFHDVLQPQRLAALRSLFEEYLRFSIEAGIFQVT